jgi:hypothetical protein
VTSQGPHPICHFPKALLQRVLGERDRQRERVRDLFLEISVALSVRVSECLCVGL